MTKADQIIGLLTEIRDLLQSPMDPPAAGEPRTCEHPEEKRVSLTAMGVRGEHFYCRACRQEIRTF